MIIERYFKAIADTMRGEERGTVSNGGGEIGARMKGGREWIEGTKLHR